jgi:hypothetical protein
MTERRRTENDALPPPLLVVYFSVNVFEPAVRPV